MAVDANSAVGGAALTEGVFTNPLLRAVLIPLGGTGSSSAGLSQGNRFSAKRAHDPETSFARNK
jgi:hypothetical protein